MAGRLAAAGEADGFLVETIGVDRGCPVLGMTRAAAVDGAPHIYLSAGIHGDEPAGPLAVLELLRAHSLTWEVSWAVAPMLCPDNLRRSDRLGPGGVDPNRDYHERRLATTRDHLTWLEGIETGFALAFCLHEDFDMDGFYVYEHLTAGQPRYSIAIIAAARRLAAIETAAEIDGFDFHNGVYLFDHSQGERSRWAEARRLIELGSRATYTLETPSNRLPIGERANVHGAAVTAAVRAWLEARDGRKIPES